MSEYDPNLYPINPPEFRVQDRHDDGENITYDLEPVNDPEVCSVCGFDTIKANGGFIRKARDLSEHEKKVGLVIHSHRYYCSNCESSWTPQYKTIDNKARMTNRMREYIRKESLRVPFSHIHKDLDISVSTIREIFADYVSELDGKHKLIAPKVLGIDENYLLNQYRCIYTDIEHGLILDLTKDRKLPTVKHWLYQLPERDRVECVTMDMWGCYREAVNSEIPDTYIVTDKFHVIKNLNVALDKIRKEKCGKDNVSKEKRKYVKNSRWLLLHNNEDLDDSQKIRLSMFLTNIPEMEEPYLLKESFRKMYKAKSREEAEKIFDDWKKDAAKYPQYKEFAEMVENWREEIFNYFDNRYTNAVTESLNNLCSYIEKQGRGYSFDVLRAKVLYGTKATQPAKFKYYTKEPDKYRPIEPYIERNGAMYELMPGLDMGMMVPQKPKKYSQLDVSQGVNISRLMQYVQAFGLWNLTPDK